jgi:hypothetical protein
LTGVEVGHSTHHRQVQKVDLSPPNIKQKLTEVGEEAISKLRKSKYVGVTNFISYLRKHRHRLVNYMYFQAEQLSSIGSGAVESAVKQIDKRLQIVGAQWKSENLPQMLQLRCAYLNRQLAPTA